MRLPFLTNSVDISPQKLIIVRRDVPRETTVQDEHSGASRSNAFGAIARTIAMQSLGTGGGCRWSWLLSQIDIYDTQPRSPQKKLWWVRWISVYPPNFDIYMQSKNAIPAGLWMSMARWSWIQSKYAVFFPASMKDRDASPLPLKSSTHWYCIECGALDVQRTAKTCSNQEGIYVEYWGRYTVCKPRSLRMPPESESGNFKNKILLIEHSKLNPVKLN